MKKILLPIAATITLSGFTTPLLVSCNKGNDIGPFEYDLSKEEFEPTIEPLGGSLSTTDATGVYLQNAMSQRRIIADDIAYTWYTLGMTSPSYTKLVVNSVGINLTNSTLSLNMHTDCNIEVTEGIQTAQDLIFEAIPLQVMYGEVTPEIGEVWGSTPADAEGQFFLQDDNWSFYQKDTIDGEDVVHQWNKAKLLEEDPTQQVIDIMTIRMALALSFPALSYYLSKTTPA